MKPSFKNFNKAFKKNVKFPISNFDFHELEMFFIHGIVAIFFIVFLPFYFVYSCLYYVFKYIKNFACLYLFKKPVINKNWKKYLDEENDTRTSIR